MPTISSLGVGSGLDSEGIISALMSVERRPVSLLATQTTDIKAQLSSVGKMQSLVAAMRDKAGAISSMTLWGQTALTSSDASAVSGFTANGSTPGRYAVSVSALASSQTITTATALPSSASLLGDGTLQIELGAWNGGVFTGDGAPKTITIGSDDTSLSDIRDKINDAGAGVTATIINDANGARLSIRSNETGKENGFKITATENVNDNDATTGLSVLGYAVGNGSAPMRLNQVASNSMAQVNGVDVESATNTLSGVADGMTLTLTKLVDSSTPVEVVVADDSAAVKTSIEEFVKAFNELATYIKDQTKYNAATKTGAPLQGDRTTIGLQWQLRGVINQGSSASSTWGRLSEIGISMKEDGTLGISASKLDDALKNPEQLRMLLATDGSDTAGSGFMDRFKDLGTSVLGEEGSLQTLQESLESRVERNDDRQDEMEDRMSRTEARIRAQYQALDASMAKLNALSSYVSQQMAMLG